MNEDKLCMKFDLNTIQHLGISMYSTLPPVLAELVANAWDADAKNVTIYLQDTDSINKSILIKDDGNGMDFEDLNRKFLLIGRNRRKSDGTELTPVLRRKVIGKKGIGKLSIFGIADEINITTVKEGFKNSFKMSLEEIKRQSGTYYPVVLTGNQKTDEMNGTSIELRKFKRKSGFDPRSIALDLAKRFLIFDRNFSVKLVHNEDEMNAIHVKKELLFEDMEIESSWNLPNENITFEYEYKNQVKGVIYSTVNPAPSKMKGIYLVARGKIVHANSFYGLRADDYAYSYLTGWLTVDFIDEDESEDLISTNREALNWENEKTEALQAYLQEVIKYIANDRKKERRKNKEIKIKTEIGLDVSEWVESLPALERPLAQRTSEAIMDSEDLDIEKSAELISYVQDVFEEGTFKDFIDKMYAKKVFAEPDLIELFKEWQIIEAKEIYKLALVRIKTIEEFEKKIKENAKEVPIMHQFLKTFPWLLDPRIFNFKDEVKYSQLLRDKFKEPDTIPEEDKRIDFLCVDLASTLFIIELKRPKLKANLKYLEQAFEYSAFLGEKKGNDPDFSQRDIKTYLICDGLVDDYLVKQKAESYRISGHVYVRTYLELLQAAHNYHKEFIDRYHEMQGEHSNRDHI